MWEIFHSLVKPPSPLLPGHSSQENSQEPFFCRYHTGFQLPFPHRPRSDFQSSQGQRLAGAEPLPTPLLLNPSCIFSLETRNVICSTIQRNRDGLLNRFIHLPPEASGFTGGCKTLRSWEHSAPQTVPGKGRDYFSYT